MRKIAATVLLAALFVAAAGILGGRHDPGGRGRRGRLRGQ